MILCSRQLGPLTNSFYKVYICIVCFSQNNGNVCFFRYGERERRDEATKDLVHQVPDLGAGERVPLQSLSDEAASHRDRACPVPHGTSD